MMYFLQHQWWDPPREKGKPEHFFFYGNRKMWVFLIIIVVILILFLLMFKKPSKNQFLNELNKTRPEIDVFINGSCNYNSVILRHIFHSAKYPERLNVYVVCQNEVVPHLQHSYVSKIYEVRPVSSNFYKNLANIMSTHEPSAEFSMIVSKHAKLQTDWDERLLSISKRGIILTQMIGTDNKSCYPTIAKKNDAIVISPHNIQRDNVTDLVPSVCASSQFMFSYSNNLHKALRRKPMNDIEISSVFKGMNRIFRIPAVPICVTRKSREDTVIGEVRKTYPFKGITTNKISKLLQMGMISAGNSKERIIKYFSDTYFERYWNQLE